MKYLAFASLLVMSNSFATVALEDGFTVDPDLKKNSSEYSEKNVGKEKVFNVNKEKEFKISKGKENGDKLDVYQLKIEKKGSEIEKLEQVVEFDKKEIGKINSMTKCGMKGGCQTFNYKLCEKLLKEDKIDEKFSKDGEEKAKQFYKDLYVKEEAFGVKSEMISKLQAMNDEAVKQVGEKPSLKELAEKIPPVYASPIVTFKKEKIKEDIAHCKLLANDFVKLKENSQPNSQPNNATTANRVNKQ